MLFFYTVIIIISLWQLFFNSKTGLNEFTTKDLLPLKGILSIGVVLGHLCFFGPRYLFPYSAFTELGLIAVNVFLFISGYGLMISLKSKGKSYFKDFGNKRLSKILIPFFFSILLYISSIFVFGGEKAVEEYLAILLNGDWEHLLPFSWYVFAILLFYCFFYLAFKPIDNTNWSIALLFVVLIIYILLLSRCAEFGIYWRRSTLAFFAGVVWAAYVNFFLNLYQKYTRFILTVIFCAAIFLLVSQLDKYPHIINVFIPFSVIILSYRINWWSNRITRFLGTISYEVYLVQGIAMFLVSRGNLQKYYILYMILVIIVTILLAYLVHNIADIVNRIGVKHKKT